MSFVRKFKKALQSIALKFVPQASNPEDANTMWVDLASNPMFGDEQIVTFGDGPFSLEFTNGDLTADVLTVNHNLNSDIVHVTVKDDSNEQVLPDVNFVDANNVALNFAGFTPLTGTYKVFIGLGIASGELANKTSNTEKRLPNKYWQDPDNPSNWYPVYRKRIDLGALPNDTTKVVAHGITNVFIKSIFPTGIAENGSGVLHLPFAHGQSEIDSIGFRWLDSTNLRLNTGVNYTSYNGWGLIEFSKTTDTPISEPN